MKTTEMKEECIDVCNGLLRGEISAVETYEKALEKFDEVSEVTLLTEMRKSHQQSVQRLKANVVSMGGTPSTDSGAWGAFAKTVQSAAGLLGENAAITALIQGEEHGINDYKSALENDDVMPECKEMIRNELLPRAQTNKRTLESLRDS
ncbi:DUF2383 domain-containing protein [Roseibacillus persicicus]|uniref:DUF2383 domain-containing protein n=1 Tax=Roseibacillus persicicus TaxID=454148 RepID=UPI00398B3C48